MLLPHMQKSHGALADALKGIRKRIENKQWTYCSRFMLKTWFCSLVPFFWFFCFLIRNFNSFCFSFCYCNPDCNWPEYSKWKLELLSHFDWATSSFYLMLIKIHNGKKFRKLRSKEFTYPRHCLISSNFCKNGNRTYLIACSTIA